MPHIVLGLDSGCAVKSCCTFAKANNHLKKKKGLRLSVVLGGYQCDNCQVGSEGHIAHLSDVHEMQ